MEEEDCHRKPFACPEVGCGMAFTNDDHLDWHKKKHDLMLNLGLIKNQESSDQTPTPTRFIRNCEEVGLFQDLQHVNPFDETFKRAVEGKESNTAGPGPLLGVPGTNEETLHTPNIFPTVVETPKSNYNETIRNVYSMDVDDADTGTTVHVEPEARKDGKQDKKIDLKLKIKAAIGNKRSNKPDLSSGSPNGGISPGEIGTKVLKTNVGRVTRSSTSSTSTSTSSSNTPTLAPTALPRSTTYATLVPNTPKVPAAVKALNHNDVKIEKFETSKKPNNPVVEARRDHNRAAQTRCRMRKKLLQQEMSTELRQLRADNIKLRLCYQKELNECRILKEQFVKIIQQIEGCSNCSRVINTIPVEGISNGNLLTEISETDRNGDKMLHPEIRDSGGGLKEILPDYRVKKKDPAPKVPHLPELEITKVTARDPGKTDGRMVPRLVPITASKVTTPVPVPAPPPAQVPNVLVPLPPGVLISLPTNQTAVIVRTPGLAFGPPQETKGKARRGSKNL